MARKTYYETRGRDWELQMLIKARVAAGELSPGRELLDAVEPRIYQSTLNFSAVEAVSATRERIHEKAKRRSRDSGLDIKLARGGIRDIEFLVQCLQRLHGGREPWVRHGGTMLALSGCATRNFCLTPSTRGSPRHTNFCATSSIGFSFSKTAKRTHFPSARGTWNCSRARCRRQSSDGSLPPRNCFTN